MSDYTIIGASSIKSNDTNVYLDVNVDSNITLKNHESSITITSGDVLITANTSKNVNINIGNTRALTISNTTVNVNKDLNVVGTTNLKDTTANNVTVDSLDMNEGNISNADEIHANKVWGAVWN